MQIQTSARASEQEHAGLCLMLYSYVIIKIKLKKQEKALRCPIQFMKTKYLLTCQTAI